MFDRLNKKLGLDISQENLRVRAEQMHALIGVFPAMISANVAVEPLVVWLMWGRLDHGALLLWIASLYVIHAQEITHWLHYPKQIRSIKECRRWQRQFLWSFGLVGALWGSAGMYMFIPGEPVLQAFMLCLMIGLAAAVVAGNQAFLLAQQGFVALVLLPILCSMLLQDNRDYYLLAAMVCLFLAFVSKAGRDQSRNLELSIRRSIENAELVDNLRRSNDQLVEAQHTAMQAELRLRSSLRQVEEKELAKTRFLAAAGHDLRQPVAAANLFVDALKNTKPTQRQGELIAKLDQSMTVFSDLLERLLNISKFDAGLVKTHIVSFDLAELFNWLEQNFAGNAVGHGLSFRYFLPSRRPLIVRTDVGLLQSVMMNLVSNAIKYTSKGGVLVAARLRRDHVLLQVWDTGCGIEDKDIGKIFDEFYQVGNPQRNREAGLGLGLSICQRAMSLLGGEITCRSSLGRGSVFELSIPLDQEHQAVEKFIEPRESDVILDAHVFEGKRVVLLEDDYLVAEGMAKLLQGRGADVLHFSNAKEALRHKDIAAADYFVVDYSLGHGLTGIAFLQALQGKTEKPIKGVIVTGETSLNFIEGIADLPWPVLHKPINYAKLSSVLSS